MGQILFPVKIWVNRLKTESQKTVLKNLSHFALWPLEITREATFQRVSTFCFFSAYKLLHVIDLGGINFEHNWFAWSNIKGLALSNSGTTHVCFYEPSSNKLDLTLTTVSATKGLTIIRANATHSCIKIDMSCLNWKLTIVNIFFWKLPSIFLFHQL
jgi:hypothetical protein